MTSAMPASRRRSAATIRAPPTALTGEGRLRGTRCDGGDVRGFGAPLGARPPFAAGVVAGAPRRRRPACRWRSRETGAACSADSARSSVQLAPEVREAARSRSRSRVTRSTIRRDASSVSSSTPRRERSSSRRRATSARSAASSALGVLARASSSARSRSVSSASATIVRCASSRAVASRAWTSVVVARSVSMRRSASVRAPAERPPRARQKPLQPRDVLARDRELRRQALAGGFGRGRALLQLADQRRRGGASRSPRRPRSRAQLLELAGQLVSLVAHGPQLLELVLELLVRGSQAAVREPQACELVGLGGPSPARSCS